MENRNLYPLVKLLLPFAAGIISAILIGSKYHIPFYIFLILLLICGAYVGYFSKRMSYRQRWIFGVFIYVMLFLCGYEITLQHTEKFNTHHYLNLNHRAKYVLVRITAPLQERERSLRADAEFIASVDSSEYIPCTGKIILYFAKTPEASLLDYGDVILVDAAPVLIDEPRNPGEFNYKRYQELRSVYHRAFVKNGHFKYLTRGYRNPLFTAAYYLRDQMLKLLAGHGMSGDEFAVTSALLIGYKDNIDPDLIKTYQGTGAMHILCVSGMHVGVMFMIFSYLLFFLDKIKRGKILKSVLLILAIWAYALVTGLSPSVLRASTMFSLILIARALNRDSSIYNSIAASALFLLLFNPYAIADTGFQLSYLAVLGIVSTQPLIAQIWKPRWWLLKRGWDIISVSIAAQLATFPLSLLYFHQFPNYFILTNIIALPLSGLIIYTGIAVLIFSFIPAISALLTKILTALVFTLNQSLQFTEQLPGAVTEGIKITVPETLMIYFLLIALVLLIVRKQKRFLFAAMGTFLLLLISFTVRNFIKHRQQKLIVYHVKNHSACDLISGNHHVFIADSVLLSDIKAKEMLKKNLKNHTGIRSDNEIRYDRDELIMPEHHFCKINRYIRFYNSRIVFVSEKESNPIPLPADYVIISGNPRISIAELLRSYETKKIIIDSSNPRYKAEKWMQECKNLGIPCHSVIHSGAFVAEIL